MSESKHTPGPWKSDATGCQPGAFSVVGDDGQRMVALVYGETREAQRANAHLIDAAPDLLRVAELLVDWLDEEEGAHKLCDKARAAIAKAEGRAP